MYTSNKFPNSRKGEIKQYGATRKEIKTEQTIPKQKEYWRNNFRKKALKINEWGNNDKIYDTTSMGGMDIKKNCQIENY